MSMNLKLLPFKHNLLSVIINCSRLQLSALMQSVIDMEP